MKMYLVVGFGEESCVFGMYSDKQRAQVRLGELEEAYTRGEDGAEYMGIETIEFDKETGFTGNIWLG